MSECIYKVGSTGSKIFHLPDTSLNLQGTIGVPSYVKLQDIFNNMEKWGSIFSCFLKI